MRSDINQCRIIIAVDVGDKVKVNGTVSVFGKSGEIHILISRLEVLASISREPEDRLKSFQILL